MEALARKPLEQEDAWEQATAAAAQGAGGAAQRFWKTTEVAVLRRVAEARGSWEELRQALPGRSDVAIYRKGRELGVAQFWVRKRRERNSDIDARLRAEFAEGTLVGGLNEFAARMGLPAWYVSRRAGQLGLSKPRGQERSWCEEELRILKERGEDGPQATQEALRKAGFQRTLGSVCMALRRHRVERAPTGAISAREAGEILGVDGKTVARWIENAGLKARRTASSFEISHRDLRRWLLDHPDAFDIRKVRQVWFMALMRGD